MRFTQDQCQSFLQHRTNVIRTGTLWLLSLPEWVGFWTRSDKWAERGQGPSKNSLSRIDPAGSFSAENVQVVSNYQSAMQGRKRKSAARMREMHGKARSSVDPGDYEDSGEVPAAGAPRERLKIAMADDLVRAEACAGFSVSADGSHFRLRLA